MNLVAVYEAALGFRPTQLDMMEREFSNADVERLISCWQDALEAAEPATFRGNRIYPLVSHHPFNTHSLFSAGARETVSERALGMVFAHDGLVCSDPIWELEAALREKGADAAAAKLAELTGRLADVEALLQARVVRFESVRPALDAAPRVAVLRAFGVEADMRVFTNFAEAAYSASTMGGSIARSYIEQGAELGFRFGVLSDVMSDTLTLEERVEQTRMRVEKIGRALLHLSWQLSVATSDAAVDLALASPLEISLFEDLIDSTALVRPHHHEGAHRTRHLLRAAAGDIPNLDRIDLSSADALAIREDDTFAGFRDELHNALDELEQNMTDRVDADFAADVFRARMAEASEKLKSSIPRTSFAQLVKSSSVPVAIEATVAAALGPDEPLRAGAFTAGGAIATVMWNWLNARRTPGSTSVAIRYTSTLGAAR